MVERIHRSHRLLLKQPQRPSIGRIMWRLIDADWGDSQCRWRSRESPVSSRSPRRLAIRRARSPFGFRRNSLVPQRRIQVRYVTVTKMRGYSCTAEIPAVSVSAVVEDFPRGSICHIPTATTRRNRARARLESEPHDLADLPLSRLRGISPGSDNSHVFRMTLNFSRIGRTLLAERLSTSTLEPIAQQLNSDWICPPRIASS